MKKILLIITAIFAMNAFVACSETKGNISSANTENISDAASETLEHSTAFDSSEDSVGDTQSADSSEASAEVSESFGTSESSEAYTTPVVEKMWQTETVDGKKTIIRDYVNGEDNYIQTTNFEYNDGSKFVTVEHYSDNVLSYRSSHGYDKNGVTEYIHKNAYDENGNLVSMDHLSLKEAWGQPYYENSVSIRENNELKHHESRYYSVDFQILRRQLALLDLKNGWSRALFSFYKDGEVLYYMNSAYFDLEYLEKVEDVVDYYTADMTKFMTEDRSVDATAPGVNKLTTYYMEDGTVFQIYYNSNIIDTYELRLLENEEPVPLVTYEIEDEEFEIISYAEHLNEETALSTVQKYESYISEVEDFLHSDDFHQMQFNE